MIWTIQNYVLYKTLFKYFGKITNFSYCRFLTDETFNAKQRIKMQDDASAREAFNVLTDEEIRDSINEAIENIDESIQIIFRSKKCKVMDNG